MKKISLFISLLIFSAYSCEKIVMEDSPEQTPESVFEVFWKNMDERYSFFTVKNIDWNDVYNTYRPLVNSNTTNTELWEIFSRMICELHDGHVNVYNKNNTLSRFDCDYPHYEPNFNYSTVINKYLYNDIRYSGNLVYGIINTTGYIYCRDFEKEITGNDIDKIINYFGDVKGVIIDIRSNGGGDSGYADLIQRRFVDKKTLVEYIYHKTGPGHDDFSEPQKVYIVPEGPKQCIKPVTVLINRYSFSSASFFASRMSSLPHVTLIGDTTGGGGGRPKYFDLPNGWYVRYSSNYALRPDGMNIELGVPPDHYVTLSAKDVSEGKDPLIDYAINWINTQD